MNLTFTEGGHLAEGLWPIGATAHFEYHCNRCHASLDAELWYHDRQTVTVVSIDEGSDGYHAFREGDSVQDRFDGGFPVAYFVRFADGHEALVLEDELLSAPEFFDPRLAEADACPPPAEEISFFRAARALLDWFEKLNHRYSHRWATA